MRSKRIAAILVSVALAAGVAASPAAGAAGDCRIFGVGTNTSANQIRGIATNYNGCSDYRARAYISVFGNKTYTAYGVAGAQTPSSGSYVSHTPYFSTSYGRIGIYTNAKKNGVNVGSYKAY